MVPECWHGDECPWHKRGRCLFKHCAPPSFELTGGDVPVEQQLRDVRRALQRLAAAVMWRGGLPIPQVVKGTLETMTERTQVIDVTVPQTTEELQERISERVHEQIVDMPVPIAQPGDQTCRGSADAVPRQGCRYACRDAKTGPPTVDKPGDQARRVHTEFIHRQVCRSPCVDAVTGTSDTDGFEDCESPAGAVHQPSSGRALEEIVEAGSAPHERVQQRTVEHLIVEQTVDVPTPQILEEIVEARSAPHERVQQRTVEQQIVDAVPHSQPQILKEVVEVVKAVKKCPSGTYFRGDR